MYGYFDYKKAYLRNNEQEIFSCYYCRLCYCLWNKGGQKARYLTTYDATVYNLILAVAGADERPQHFPCQRVRTTNRNFFKDDVMGNLMADLVILGFAVKVRDNRADGDTVKAFFADLLFKKLMDKTVTKYKEFFDKSYAAICEMDKLQSADAPAEEVLSAYGKIMENSFRHFFSLDEKFFRLINATARWIFLIDMIDDYDDDIKHNAVNSLIRKDCSTVRELFDRHYNELLPLIQSQSRDLQQALSDVRCEKAEWTVLSKVIRHSTATLVPDILSGKDVRYHYFKNTLAIWRGVFSSRRVIRKYEKDPLYYQGN